MEETLDNPESLNQEGEAEPETASEETPLEEVLEEPDEELKKTQELAKNQKIRAEKAERELKQLKSQPVKEIKEVKPSDLSLKDQYALLEAKVNLEDLDEVMDYAKLKSISIAAALKTPVIKAILSEREEERTSAKVANTAQVKRGAAKVSDETLLQRAERNELEEDEIERLVEARMNRKLKDKGLT